MKLDSLTGLRAILAILVVIAHACYRLGLLEHPGWLSYLASQTGHFGVIGFFILSGFILQSVYTAKSWTIRDYSVNRFARIYPLYLCGLLFTLPIDWFTPYMSSDNKSIALSLTITLQQAWFGFANGRFNGPGWTLSVEFFFYACFPFLFLLLRKSKICFFAIFAILFITTAAVWDPKSFMFSYRFPFWRLWEFMAGMAGALFLVRFKDLGGNNSWWIACLVLVAGFLVGATVRWLEYGQFAGWLIMAFSAWICIFLLGASDLVHARKRPISGPFWVIGGEISYGVYLFHDGVQRYAKVATEWVSGKSLSDMPIIVWILYFLATTATSVILAYVSWRIIENPARSYLRKMLHGHHKA